ncbi:DUF6022 family protein [Paenibacillus sp. FSL K6-3182]|uniref:DUF6022 family protein n=1 Tax=Paenibacillus sp. FSL K6-3182 TaxID=2921495 RepID=UPI0030CD3E5D
MKHTNPLQAFLEESDESTIAAIASYITNHINESWESILLNHQDILQKAYSEAGDAAYGTFLNLMFLPVHRQFKESGFHLEPKLPGHFDLSREWGNAEETDQQRWMWSTVYSSNDEAIGTVVTITFHDHTMFRIPRQPQIIALSATSKADVIAALSLLSPDFEQALEFTVEYENYLRRQQG